MASIQSLPADPRPPTGPSTEDLKRFHAKLAFYEQPITSFDRPVENDPLELAYLQPNPRMIIVDKKEEASITNEHEPRIRTCFLTRFARRAIAAMKKLLSSRHTRYDDPTRRGGNVYQEKCPKAMPNQRMQAKVITPSAPRHRFQEIDESTRFRLELAGIRVQNPPPAYTVCV